MASGPYQSNVLRFFVRQYWQGLARHQKAVRQTRHTVVLGAQLGCSVSATVAYTALKAVQLTGSKVKQLLFEARSDVKKTLLSGLNDEAVRLLNFSDFARLPAVFGVSAVESSHDTPCLAERSNTDSLVAEDAMVRSLVAAVRCLGPAQIKALSSAFSDHESNCESGNEKDSSAITRFVKKGKAFIRRWNGWQPALAFTDALSDTTTEDIGSSVRSITGIASDLKTRSLVLITEYKTVWPGLNAEQQSHLQRKVRAFLQQDQIPANVFSANVFPAILPSSTVSEGIEKMRSAHAMVQPVHSFWLAVWQIWLDWRPAWNVSSMPMLSTDVGSLSNCLPVRSPIHLTPSRLNNMDVLTIDSQADSAFTEFINVDSMTVEYIEHPLERLLNWVDRIFLWLEKQWRALKSTVLG